MKHLTRRKFLLALLVTVIPTEDKVSGSVMTVSGKIRAARLGRSLIHEHILVDFIGADQITTSRWNKEEVIKTVLPFLKKAKQVGVQSFFDCTPAFLGRDVALLKELSKKSGLRIITNTGYYGAVKNKYLPAWAFTESADQLARRWINEFRFGIDGSGVKPGFIKIGVDSDGPLSDLHKKLITAAALTHLETGLTIFSHTGLAKAAFEQLHILKEIGVDSSAFVWVHAQAEKDISNHVKAASENCWVSLDGIGWGDLTGYVEKLQNLKAAGFLNRVLISHDAGWYKPGEDQSSFKSYTNIFTSLIPQLMSGGFDKKDIDQLLIRNPAAAMAIKVRKHKR